MKSLPPESGLPDRGRPAGKRRRRWILRGAGLLLAAFLALNALAFRHAEAMMTYRDGGRRSKPPEALTLPEKAWVLLTGVNLPRPETCGSPDSLSPDATELELLHPDGVRLNAWYADRGPGTPLVIVFHGYGADKCSLLPEAVTWLDLGCSVLLVDFRGSGGSSESYTTLGVEEALDVRLAVETARTSLRHGRIILHGVSMGAAAILRAVAYHGVHADALVLEAVFDRMRTTVANRFHAMGLPAFPAADLLVFWGGKRMGYNGFAHNPMEDAKRVAMPTLIFQGQYDQRARPEDGKRVFDALPGEKHFVVFPEAAHVSFVTHNPGLWKSALSPVLGGQGRKLSEEERP